MKVPRATPIALAAHRFGRQLRAAGAAVALPDLHRTFDGRLRDESINCARLIGLAVLLFFVAILGARGNFRFSLGFLQLDAPVLYIAFFAALLLLGGTFSILSIALIAVYRARVTRMMVGRRAGFYDLAPVLSGQAVFGDMPLLGTSYLRTSARYRAAFSGLYLLIAVPLTGIYLIVLWGLTALMGSVLFGADQAGLDRLIALCGLMMLAASLGLLAAALTPARLGADRDMVRNLLLLGIANRAGRLHPRYRIWNPR